MEMSVKEEIEDHIIKQETSSVQKICRFCYNTFEKDIVKVEEKEREMMRILCLTLDLSMSENPLICSTCQRKLEECYNFKKVCIYTEECIAPHVVENVKVNWNEICGQIIDCEDGMDINLCRLCMQPTDNDMTVNNEDKEQFEQFFPEVNLNVTSFVVLCTKCYNSFQKLLVFISSCLEWEEKLHSYSEGGQVCLENFLHYLKYQTPSKDELVDMKAEERMLVKNERQEEADQKFALTNSELEIKDEDETDEMSVYKCQDCTFESTSAEIFKKHVKQHNLNSPKPKNYPCQECDRQFKVKRNLRRHVEFAHTDPSQVTKFKCKQCHFNTRYEQHMRQHTELMHTDASSLVMHECEFCEFKTKYKKGLRRHIRVLHGDPSQIQMHKCKDCNRLFKTMGNLRKHVRIYHEAGIYKCEECDFETRYEAAIKKHGDIQCGKCDFESKCRNTLRAHMLLHSNPSKILKCGLCWFQSIHRKSLKNHMKNIHSTVNQVEMLKCPKCDYKSKYKGNVKRHIDACKLKTNIQRYASIITR